MLEKYIIFLCSAYSVIFCHCDVTFLMCFIISKLVYTVLHDVIVINVCALCSLSAICLSVICLDHVD